jgi:hypothetical protein
MTRAGSQPLGLSLPREAKEGGRRCAPAALKPSSDPTRRTAARLAPFRFQGKDWRLPTARGGMP